MSRLGCSICIVVILAYITLYVRANTLNEFGYLALRCQRFHKLVDDTNCAEGHFINICGAKECYKIGGERCGRINDFEERCLPGHLCCKGMCCKNGLCPLCIEQLIERYPRNLEVFG